MASKPILKCGCAANAYIGGTDIPTCVVHGGTETMPTPANLSSRTATCGQKCKVEVSNTNLPFFQSRPDLDHDLYYCGCRGWD